MISVAVSGAGGRMGALVAETVDQDPTLELAVLFDPGGGVAIGGCEVDTDAAAVTDVDVVVEFTHPDVVMDNLATWRDASASVVVGTSGFGPERIARLRELWSTGPPNVLVAPNFSIGAVVMMKLAELAAPHFAAADIVELHHDQKADAPSGTALATAERVGGAMEQRRQVRSTELRVGATGAEVNGVPVHSVRLPGLVAHQSVMFGNPGETLTIRHDTTDRASFMGGVILAINSVGGLTDPVSIGLEALLGI